jgi:hypothetical protein
MPKSKVRPKAAEKKKAAARFKAAGKTHVVDKHKDGSVNVHHPDGGKSYNLSKLAGAVTIGSGVKATKKFHSKKGGGE